jgi:hypothetical protein
LRLAKAELSRFAQRSKREYHKRVHPQCNEVVAHPMPHALLLKNSSAPFGRFALALSAAKKARHAQGYWLRPAVAAALSALPEAFFELHFFRSYSR